MIFFLVLTTVSIAWSALVLGWLGLANYGPVTLIAFSTLLVLFAANERTHRRLQALKIERRSHEVVIDFVTLVVIAAYLGATWPSLPLIVGFGRWTRGRGDVGTSSPAAESSDPRSRSERA